MSGIKYTQKQIKELKNNKYVKNATSKSITFTLECKLKVLELSKKWIFYIEIFKKLWFPEYIIDSQIPKRSYHRWNNKYAKWSIEDKKWRTKKDKIDFNNMTKDEELEYLRAKVAYLEEVEKLIKQWLP